MRSVLTSAFALGGILTLVGCGGGGGFPDAKVNDDSLDPPPGKFRLKWALTDKANATISCDRVSALVVTATLRSTAVAGGSTQVFTCGVGAGTSQSIIPGTYSVEYELTGGAGVLATAPRSTNVVIESGATIDLDPIVFAVEATGGLALHFTTNKAGGNCGLLAANGAGITSTTITLEHTPTTMCEPVVLTIGAGATQPATTYTVDCATPAAGPCIENDQSITTTTTIPSGGYQIHIRGKIGAAECWTNDDMFSVPPIMATLMRTLNLGLATGTPGC